MSQGVPGVVERVPYRSLLACVLLLAGCTTTSQMYSAQIIADPSSASLKSGDLASFGIAFITPSTVTGQEEDKSALALAFSKALEAQRPNEASPGRGRRKRESRVKPPKRARFRSGRWYRLPRKN
jgi:hypothetical protein